MLIPFADEQLFIEEEKKLDLKLDGEETERNTVSFVYSQYTYDEYQSRNSDRTSWVPLKSALGSMRDLPNDCVSTEACTDYERVGTVGFSSRLLTGVKSP